MSLGGTVNVCLTGRSPLLVVPEGKSGFFSLTKTSCAQQVNIVDRGADPFPRPRA